MSLARQAAGVATAFALALPLALAGAASAETLIRIQSVIPTSADEVVMLEDFAADHSKVDRSAMARLGHMADIDAFFTDAPLPPELAFVLQESGTQVVVADLPPS